jgi:hypothetical protein
MPFVALEPGEFRECSHDTERLAYSLKEVTEMLGVSEGHLRNENRRQKLRFTKSASRTLILATELQRYLRELPERPIPSR